MKTMFGVLTVVLGLITITLLERMAFHLARVDLLTGLTVGVQPLVVPFLITARPERVKKAAFLTIASCTYSMFRYFEFWAHVVFGKFAMFSMSAFLTIWCAYNFLKYLEEEILS